MRTKPLLFLLLTTILTTSLFAQSKRNKVKYEGTEWTNIWIPSANKNDLPRVLLIGNSITQGYYNFVKDSLQGKAYVARYTTSRGIIDPVLFKEIKTIIQYHKFTVIHFNNGLHGYEYTPEQYETGLKKLVKVLKKYGQGAELIGATSTRVLPGFKSWKSDEYNQKLIETRNRIMIKVCRENNIEVDDLYEVTKDHPEWFSADKIHYKKIGFEKLGNQVTNYISKKLGTSLIR